MIQDVLTRTGEPKDKIELPDAVFGQKVRKDLIWQSVNRFRANQRQGTAKTKTRAEVSGGGKKPWRQKHTGMARHGSTRSPIWRHGGVVFGPLPRDYDQGMPIGQRQFALRAALSMKLKDNGVRVVEDFELAAPKTKELARIVSDLGLKKNRTLLLTGEPGENLKRAARNLPNLTLMRARDVNVYAVLAHHVLLLTRAAVEALAQKAGAVQAKAGS